MGCNFAKFVIHYKDGSTVVENRNDPYSWDNAPKKDISALGILLDPINTGVKDPTDNKILRLTIPEHTLKGSKKYNYQFFQMKDAMIRMIRGKTSEVLSLMVGMVINPEGQCVVMFVKPDYSVKTFFTNVHSLGLNLELFNINLGECGKELGDNIC